MATKKQEKRKSRVVSAKRRITEHKVGNDRSSLKVPEGTTFFQMKRPGVYRIDIIPFVVGKGNPFANEGDLYYERTFYVHRGIGPNQDSYICPRETLKKPCPICDHRAKLMKDPDADEDLIKDLAPKERQLFWVYDHAAKDKGVQLWDISYHLFGKTLDAMIRDADETDNYDTFADPEAGMTLKVGAEEKTFGGRTFCSTTHIEFKPRTQALDEDLLEAATCLDDMIKVFDYKDLKKIFLEATSPEDEEEEEEKPTRGKKKPKEEEEDDDDDEEGEDEDEGDDSEESEDDEEEESDDSDSDDDDESDDEEEEESEIKVGSTVSFKYRKKTLTGKVKKINGAKGLAHVKCDDQDMPHIVNLDELSLEEEEEEETEEEEEETEDDDIPFEEEEEEEETEEEKKPVKKKRK